MTANFDRLQLRCTDLFPVADDALFDLGASRTATPVPSGLIECIASLEQALSDALASSSRGEAWARV